LPCARPSQEGTCVSLMGEDEDITAQKLPGVRRRHPGLQAQTEASRFASQWASREPRSSLPPPRIQFRGSIKELKGYGVDARPLDMLSSVAGGIIYSMARVQRHLTAKVPFSSSRPSRMYESRLPDLSHVFVMGVQEGRVDSYTPYCWADKSVR